MWWQLDQWFILGDTGAVSHSVGPFKKQIKYIYICIYLYQRGEPSLSYVVKMKSVYK